MDEREFHRDDEARAKPVKKAEPKPLRPAIGNAALQRLLPSLPPSGPATVDETVARAIHAKRGLGRPLDAGVQRELGKSMGHDFSDVNVHTDSEADQLNRAVHAEAFTTGKDVFFREGKYDPGSNSGKKLLAHELTHVVQQRDAPPKHELTLSDPGDASERQASAAADSVTSPAPAPAAGVARQEKQGDEEEEQVATAGVDREAAPEEEKEEDSGG
jgi:hypothetical protein